VIKEESSRLANLIDDILNLSKLESRKVKVNKTNFKVEEILKNKVYYNSAHKKGITMDFNIHKDMELFADKEKFIQIYINLIGNAIKYTEKGGRVEVIAKDKRKEGILKIKDTGIGIEKDEIPKLFDKFYRIEDYMTSSRQGAGLGLAIVKKLVDLHNGKIEVTSKIGRGSTFTVSFPKN